MKKQKAIVTLLILFISFSLSLFSQPATPPILDETILKKIRNEISGGICFEHVRKLSTLHRIWGSSDYHSAAQYMVDKAAEYGLKESRIEKYPIKTGKENFWMHSTGGYVPWDCQRGEIRLVSPYPLLLSDFESAASTVAVGSRSTDTTAELVYVGRGDSEEAYKGKDVTGKIVLAEGGRHENVHELAVHRFGALGTLQFYDTEGNYLESEGIYWAMISPWNKEKTRDSTFGFNLSTRQGLFLKDLLAKGEKVLLSATISAQVVENGSFELATAVIPGEQVPEEEFIFYAHLDHPKPGAHDNASGDAVLLEIARSLSRLIDKKIIARPVRSIRFMWIPHMSGLNMYLVNHPEKIGKIKAGCNVDCVGLNQARFPSKFYIALPPHSLPTYLTDITNNLVDSFNQKFDSAIGEGAREDLLFTPEGSRNLFSATLTPYQGASDEYTANTRSLNIPSVYFHDYPIPPRHNQINFLDYIDATSLGRVSYLGAIISYAFAGCGGEMALRLLEEISFRGENRLSRELVKAKNLIESSQKQRCRQEFLRGGELLFWGLRREKGIVGSLREVFSDKKSFEVLSSYGTSLENKFKDFKTELERSYQMKCAELKVNPDTGLPPGKRTSKEIRIPVLNPAIKGSPGYFSNYFEEKLGEDFLAGYKSVRPDFSYGNVGYYETLNFVDGDNTIENISQAVISELWSGDYLAEHSLTLEETTQYIQMLKDAGVLEFKIGWPIRRQSPRRR
jgi:hypothetical protein